MLAALMKTNANRGEAEDATKNCKLPTNKSKFNPIIRLRPAPSQ